MGRLAVRPKVDLAFKKIFTENENLLKDLLSATLDIDVADIDEMHLENPDMLPGQMENKFCRFDLKIKMKGRLIDVEMQLNNRGNFQNRALYYWSRLFSQALPARGQYSSLPETIVICFVDFDLFGCTHYHSKFLIKEEQRNEVLTDKFAIHFFELKKLPEKINKDNKLELWLKLLGAETYEELDEALKYVKRLNADEKVQQWIEMLEEAWIEEASAIGHAHE